MRKIASIILLLAIISTALISCESNRSYDEDAVLSEAAYLIEKSERINEIFYGEGIPYDKNESYSNGAYYPADQNYMDGCDFKTVEELEKRLREVYSKGLSDIIVDTKLSSTGNETGILGYARYYQKYVSLDDKTPECIMVYSQADILLDCEVVYDYSSIKVLGSKGEFVIVEISATVTNPEGDSQKRTIKVNLIEEESGWKLDTPTYLRYLKEDYYEEFQ